MLIKKREYAPIRSDGTFPLLNRPVGMPPWKSLPYGGKLERANDVVLLLLLPVSTTESPNTNTAGTDTSAGSFTKPLIVLHETSNIINVKRSTKEEEGRKWEQEEESSLVR